MACVFDHHHQQQRKNSMPAYLPCIKKTLRFSSSSFSRLIWPSENGQSRSRVYAVQAENAYNIF